MPSGRAGASCTTLTSPSAAILELLRAADPAAGNFAPGRPAIGYAFFRGLDSAVPDFVAALADGGATRARLPFAVVDPADPGHWYATVAERARLEPVVEYADEAIAQAGEATLRSQEETDPGRAQPRRRDDLGGMGIEWRPKHHAR
jgi:hypothetical protein